MSFCPDREYPGCRWKRSRKHYRPESTTRAGVVSSAAADAESGNHEQSEEDQGVHPEHGGEYASTDRIEQIGFIRAEGIAARLYPDRVAAAVVGRGREDTAIGVYREVGDIGAGGAVVVLGTVQPQGFTIAMQRYVQPELLIIGLGIGRVIEVEIETAGRAVQSRAAGRNTECCERAMDRQGTGAVACR